MTLYSSGLPKTLYTKCSRLTGGRVVDALKLLMADHKKMNKLVKQVASTTEKMGAKRKKIFTTIKHEAKLHEQIEEKYLYSILRKNKKSKPNALEHFEEVALMEHLIKQLSTTSTGSEKWTAKFKVFQELTEHHIKEEEEEKFPEARKLLTKDQLEEIGDKMQAFKKKHNIK